MENKFPEWKEFEKELDISLEQEEEIRLEMEIIKATIEARKNKKMSQEELSIKSGIKQPSIARIEKGIQSPTINSLLRILYPLGYTLKVVPINKKKS